MGIIKAEKCWSLGGCICNTYLLAAALTGVLADAAAPTDKPLDSTWVAFHVLLA